MADELACVYAALVLLDDDVAITVSKFKIYPKMPKTNSADLSMLFWLL